MISVIYFTAPWCVPCKTISPYMNSIANKINLIKIDCDRDPATAELYGVSGLPTIIIMNNSEIVKQLTGSMSVDKIKFALLDQGVSL